MAIETPTNDVESVKEQLIPPIVSKLIQPGAHSFEIIKTLLGFRAETYLNPS